MRPFLLLATLLPCLALAAQDMDEKGANDAPSAAPAGALPASAAASPGAAAATPQAAVEVAPLPAPPPPPPAEAPFPRLGFAVGAGVPAGATLSVVYRPVPFLRLHAGPSWDYLGWGLHGGLTLAPFRWVLTPTLGAEVGRFFSADVARVTSPPVEARPLLRDIGVSYVSTFLGLEIGSQRGFAFDLRVGLAWLQAKAHGTGQLSSSGGISGANDATIVITDPTFRGTMPTVQLGFQYFL